MGKFSVSVIVGLPQLSPKRYTHFTAVGKSADGQLASQMVGEPWHSLSQRIQLLLAHHAVGAAEEAPATTKWGIEGFFEGIIPEIAKFGIEVTLVEPGTARTNIASSSDDTTPMKIYEDTPVGDFRRAIALHGEKILIGDPVKMAQAMIASCELKPAPRRLVLGSDAYQHIEASLVERLALLRSQKELAFSTDLSS